MDNFELMQLVVLGFCTGLGAVFAAELVAQLKKRLEKVNERPKN